MGDAQGEIVSDEGVLIIRRIHVNYRLRATDEQREAVERTHSMHARYCPVYRSLIDSIEITTSYELETES